MSDYHLHLVPHDLPAEAVGSFSERIERYVEAGAERGVTELAITEHLYRCRESATALGRWWDREPKRDLAEMVERVIALDRTLSLDAYVEAVVAARDAGLPVKLGMEVDFFPETIDAVLELLAPYPFDVLIGSVHWVGGWALDDDRAEFEWERRGVAQAWDDYFAVEEQLAASGAVDVLAHVDVIKKLGHRPEREPVEWYDRVVAAAASSGTAVEVSSQGLRNRAGEAYPGPAFLERFAAAEVPITFGSDAHDPDTVGDRLPELVAAARAAGYDSHLRFTARRPEPTPLPVFGPEVVG